MNKKIIYAAVGLLIVAGLIMLGFWSVMGCLF